MKFQSPSESQVSPIGQITLSQEKYTRAKPVEVALVAVDVVLLVVFVVVLVGVMVDIVMAGSAAHMRNVDLAAFVLVDKDTPNPPSQLQYVVLTVPVLVVFKSQDVTDTADAPAVVAEAEPNVGAGAEAVNVVPLISIGSNDVYRGLSHEAAELAAEDSAAAA